jgi:hypothetical protein
MYRDGIAQVAARVESEMLWLRNSTTKACGPLLPRGTCPKPNTSKPWVLTFYNSMRPLKSLFKRHGGTLRRKLEESLSSYLELIGEKIRRSRLRIQEFVIDGWPAVN